MEDPFRLFIDLDAESDFGILLNTKTFADAIYAKYKDVPDVAAENVAYQIFTDVQRYIKETVDFLLHSVREGLLSNLGAGRTCDSVLIIDSTTQIRVHYNIVYPVQKLLALLRASDRS